MIVVISTITQTAHFLPSFFRSLRCVHSVISRQVVVGPWTETGCNQAFPVDHWTRAPERQETRRTFHSWRHESCARARASVKRKRPLPSPFDPAFSLLLHPWCWFLLSRVYALFYACTAHLRGEERRGEERRRKGITYGREAKRQSCVAIVRARKGTKERGIETGRRGMEGKLTSPWTCNWWNAGWINRLCTPSLLALRFWSLLSRNSFLHASWFT